MEMEDNTTQIEGLEDTDYDVELEAEGERGYCSFAGDDPLTMFLIGGVGMSFVSLMGMIGNLMSAIVLSRPSMRTSTNILLLGLSICDFVYGCMTLVSLGIPNSIEFFCVDRFEYFFETILNPITATYFVPLLLTAQLGSTYFTVGVTLERCFVVYRPLLARPYCTNKNAIRVSLVIGFFTILFNIPSWWNFRIESIYDENGEWTNYGLIHYLWNDSNYMLYYRNWMSTFVFRIVPMLLLTLLNITIYLKVREANKLRGRMTQSNSSDIALARMLVWIVSIFIMCNSLPVYLNVVEALHSPEPPSESPEVYTAGVFLFNLNSAVNFIIYCCTSKKFRLMFLELFWPNKWRGRSSNSIRRNEGSGSANSNIHTSWTITQTASTIATTTI